MIIAPPTEGAPTPKGWIRRNEMPTPIPLEGSEALYTLDAIAGMLETEAERRENGMQSHDDAVRTQGILIAARYLRQRREP